MKLLPLLVAAGVAACTVDPLEEAPPETPEPTARLAVNRLAANKLSAASLAAATAGDAALGEATELAATDDGREVLTYIASCALPAGATLQVGAFTFGGEHGLAPAWATRAPTTSERRWVTACVLARTNLFGVSVRLSLRGAHPVLRSSLAENLGYTLIEGAFYGDLFDPEGAQLYACASELRDLRLELGTQAQRACVLSDDGETTRCGFTYTGHCAVLDLSLAPACSTLGAPYGRCRAPGGEIFDEVITVALETRL